MARCDFAEQHILPDQAGQPTMRATQVIMHSMASPGATPLDLIARWSQPGTPLESHFIVGRDGRAYQLIDTARSADANYHANLRPDGTGAISIETEDNIGHPDALPWTDAQVATLVRLALWAHEVHGVPRRQCRSPSDPGQGFHTLFGAPSEWTPVAKTCPGTIRIRQWREVILPAIQAGQVPQEDDMTEEQARQLKAVYQALIVPGTTSPEETVNLLFSRVRTIEAVVTAEPEPLEPVEVGPLEVQVDEAAAAAIAQNLATNSDFLRAIAVAVADEQYRRQAG
jgi:hypothetical protein